MGNAARQEGQMQGTDQPGRAIVMMLLAMAMFGLLDNFMRLAAQTGGLWQFHLLRSVVALGVLAAVAVLWGISLRPKRPLRVLVRSVLNAVAMVIYFGCLGLMPIAQAVVGLFTAPLFVVLLSWLFWGDRVGARRIAAVMVGFAGIVLVLRPDQTGVDPMTFLPVAAGAAYALANMTTRRWCVQEGTLALLAGSFGCMMLAGGLGCVVIALWQPAVSLGAEGFATRGWVVPTGIFGIIIVAQGVGALVGVGLSIRAYQLADATLVAVFENALLIFATIWAAILWQEWPDMIGLSGLALIAGAGVVIAIRDPAPQTVRTVTLPQDPA